MLMSFTIFLIGAIWTIAPSQSVQSYTIVPNDTSHCNVERQFQRCYTLQQFAEVYENLSKDISLSFSPGEHLLVGGIELNNTVNVIIEGQQNNGAKAVISCKENRCFSFYNSSRILITNLVFTKCVGEDWVGGAIFVNEAEDVSITQCLFVSNSVRKHGGAMGLFLIKRVHIFHSQFINNSALCRQTDAIEISGTTYCLPTCSASSGAFSGGYIKLIIIEDSLFNSNKATCGTGAISLKESTIIIQSSTIKDCYCRSVIFGIGGGLAIFSSSLKVTNSSFIGNWAGQNGGSINALSSTVNISNSIFHSNRVTYFGGALHSYDTVLFIDNCIFWNNSALFGGAMYAETGKRTALIVNSHFQSNTVSECGGAIFLHLGGFPECTQLCSNNVTQKPIAYVKTTSFVSNKAGAKGGAIAIIFKGAVKITDSEFISNYGKIGGAVYSNLNIVFTQGCTFVNNNSTFLGGAWYSGNGTVFSQRNKYISNKGGSGGAFHSVFSTLVAKEDQYMTNQARKGSGGAIFSLRSSVSILGCNFSKNSASFNGGGAVLFNDGIFNSINSSYTENLASRNGSALFLIASSVNIDDNIFRNNIGNSMSQESHQTTTVESTQAYTIQLTNTNGGCKNLDFTNNTGSFYLFFSTLSFLGVLSFTNNTGITGGALTLAQSTASFEYASEVNIDNNRATYGGGIFVSQSELRIFSPLLRILGNVGTIGGAVYGYQCQITIRVNDLSSSVVLAGNLALQDGGALYAIATTMIIVRGSVIFTKNVAIKGGAAVLSQGSKIYIHKTVEEAIDQRNIKLYFTNNSAEYGGALYIADNTNTGTLCELSVRSRVQTISSEECFIQTLRLYYPLNSTFEYFNYANVFFRLNKASRHGNDLYGGLLDRCQINALSEIYNFGFVQNFTGFDYLKIIAHFDVGVNYRYLSDPFNLQLIITNITREQVKGLITSDPAQLCFCEGNTYNCSYQWPTIFSKKGETFSISAAIVDQVENPVNGTTLANVISKGTRLRVGQSQQVMIGVCNELTYNVFSTEANATIELYPMGPCESKGISSKYLNIAFLPCECPNGLQPAPLDNECSCDCDSALESYFRSCQLKNDSITVVRETENYWIQYDTGNNVSGFILQPCPYDYCIDKPTNLSINLPLKANTQCAFNRSGIMCGECEEGLSLVFGSSRCVMCSNNYLALLVAFAAAGVALVAFILILNMTVAVGNIHGLILYANIVAANSATFLPSQTTLRIFVSWVNLDLGIETCFYDGMDSLAKVLLQTVFPAYIILLTVLIIIVSHYWGWFAGLIGRKNPVATLCTLFLLSYSKLVRNIIFSLQFSYISYPDGSSKNVWLYNPNILNFALSRIPLFVISILILALGTVYTMLLFFGQWIRKINREQQDSSTLAKFFQSTKYNTFIDAYHAPFVFKHRYWIGILLFTRIFHHLLSAVLNESTHMLIVSSIVSLLFILKLLAGKMYKNWLTGCLEVSWLINLLLFSVSTYYVNVTNGDQLAVANTSVFIAFITFLGIVLYHTHTYFLKNFEAYSKLVLALKWCFKQLTVRCQTIPNRSNIRETATKSRKQHTSREPALDDIAPLLEEDYTPPAPTVTNFSPRPVTTTVVCVDSEDTGM